MKLFVFILLALMGTRVWSQENHLSTKSTPLYPQLLEAAQLFEQTKYDSSLKELIKVEDEEKKLIKPNKEMLGLISYWKGIIYNRLKDYDSSALHFKESLGYGYNPKDLHYEYAQSLYANHKWREARLHFQESLKRNFKRDVSLYYVGYIAKILGETKKSLTIFKSIIDQDDLDNLEIKQAASWKIAEIYLELVERHPDNLKAVEKNVLPKYEMAYRLDPDSDLAKVIKLKKLEIQRKFDLAIVQLRNGRPVPERPYFATLGLESGWDSNVTFAPTQTTVAKSKQGSALSKTSAFGRYTFYHQDYFSITPELTFNSTRYLYRTPEVYRNDNYLFAPAVRTAYEHTIRNGPASLLIDYDYNDLRRDVDQTEKLKFSLRSHALTFGERVNFFNQGESAFRLRYRKVDAYINDADSYSLSYIFEQAWKLPEHIFLFYLSYDQLRTRNDIYNTNALNLRGDFLLKELNHGLIPTLGLGLGHIDPFNDRSNRGREYLFNPYTRLSKKLNQNWRGNLKLEYQKYFSKETQGFAYNKTIFGLELEYIF